MKTALITTTINIPHVLKLYRACGPDVAFFVAGDLKTPHDAAMGSDVPHFMSAEYQHTLGYACSDLIGWNTISRRNIALLEALKWGAEIIVTIDDDNIPMSTDYFDRFEMVLGSENESRMPCGAFSGISIASRTGWFDPGRLLFANDEVAHVSHRGFPQEHQGAPWTAGFVVDAKIGVAAGLCLGDPDTSAVERMSWYPEVHKVSELGRVGIVVDPSTRTVFNSQNTAFLRELAPCFLMCPQFGRYDDIFASLVAQRVMRKRNLHVHFGQPFVWQQRNPHKPINDLKAELFGMEHVVEFAEWLDDAVFPKDAPALGMVRALYRPIQNLTWMPPGVSELGQAWCDDVEKVL